MKKHFNNGKLCGLALITAVLLLIGGCAIKGVGVPAAPVTVCDQFPGPSMIEQYIPDLRAANTLLKLSVYEVSRLQSVQKKDIVKFLDEAEAMAASTTTYSGFASYVLAKVKFIQQSMGAEVMIAGDYLITFQATATPISARDVCYIKYQIADTRAKVLPWIPAK